MSCTRSVNHHMLTYPKSINRNSIWPWNVTTYVSIPAIYVTARQCTIFTSSWSSVLYDLHITLWYLQRLIIHSPTSKGMCYIHVAHLKVMFSNVQDKVCGNLNGWNLRLQGIFVATCSVLSYRYPRTKKADQYLKHTTRLLHYECSYCLHFFQFSILSLSNSSCKTFSRFEKPPQSWNPKY